MNRTFREDAVPPDAEDNTDDSRVADEPPPSVGARAFSAFFAFITGLYCFGVAMKVPALADVSIGAPRWLIGIVGGICWLVAFAGLAYDNPRLKQLMSLVVMLMVVGLAVGFVWIGFGPGPRACSSSFSFFGARPAYVPADLECRLAFGWGAVFIGSIAVMAVFSMIEEWFGASALTKTGNKFGKYALFASLAPLVLVVLVIAPFKIAIDAVRRRLDLGE